MSTLSDFIFKRTESIPCLFYPVAKKQGIPLQRLLTDPEVQADLLVEIARHYPVGAVVRMTELWCEAAGFGMACEVTEHDFPGMGEPIWPEEEDWEEAVMPPCENETTGPLIEAVRLAVPRLGKPLIVGVTGPYTLCSVLTGSENFMMSCMTEPEAALALLNKITDFLIGYISVYREAGAAGIMLAEPSTAMISPTMMDEFSNGFVRKIIDAVQDEAFSLIYHNCGSINAQHLETLVQLPVDGFHFGSDIDLGRALTLMGPERLILGNIDPRLFNLGTTQAVLEQSQRLLKAYAGYRNWRLSTGCDLSPRASMNNVDCMLQCHDQFFEVAQNAPST